MLGLPALTVIPVSQAEPSDRISELIEHLVSVTSCPGNVADFGAEYIRRHPDERIETMLGGLSDHIRFDLASGIDEVAQLIRKEFGRGEMLSIDGWLVARSEARIWALSTLV